MFMNDDSKAMPPTAEPWPPLSFWEGVAQFNRGDFYACHDTLEAIWMVAPTPEKSFYQGILQLAVGLYHLGNHNWRGAAILLGEGSRRLEAYEPDFQGIHVSDLLDRAELWLQTLQSLGPDRVAEVAIALLSPPDSPASATAGAMATGLDMPQPHIYLLPDHP
ncbi:MAG: DUF309 domain-containing protein [Leptolyngbya sp.]|nr:DUF309 domain-containing protein [Leptolyngbya sp.]